MWSIKLRAGWSAIETHSGDGYIFVGRDVEDETLRNQWLDYYDATANPTYVKKTHYVRKLHMV